MSIQVFQIGFNKCATTALYNLFARSGVRALHSGGRHWRRQGHPAFVGKNPQLEIHRNILAKRPSLTGYEEFQALFDMEYARGPELVENFRHFHVFAKEFPDAKFILNTRDKIDWLRSRARHGDGKYIMYAMKRMQLSREEVLQAWSDDFDRHNEKVQKFFLAEKDRLLDLNIDTAEVSEIIRFVKPDIKLWPRFWKRIRVTDQVAARLEWTETELHAESE